MVPRYVKAYYDAVAVRRRMPRWLRGEARSVYAAVLLARDFEEAVSRLVGLGEAAGALVTVKDGAAEAVFVNGALAVRVSVSKDDKSPKGFSVAVTRVVAGARPA